MRTDPLVSRLSFSSLSSSSSASYLWSTQLMNEMLLISGERQVLAVGAAATVEGQGSMSNLVDPVVAQGRGDLIKEQNINSTRTSKVSAKERTMIPTRRQSEDWVGEGGGNKLP
jgi:hypothetical protein